MSAFRSTETIEVVRWVENVEDRELQPGEKMLVQLVCAAFRLGPWNLTPWRSLRAIGVDGASFCTRASFCTTDSDGLTRFVILAHDRGIRAFLVPGGPGRLKIVAHQRYDRAGGSIMTACPTIESMISDVRAAYPPPDELPPNPRAAQWAEAT